MTDKDPDFELRIRTAERQHDSHRKGLSERRDEIGLFSIAAMRAPALVAAGGVAAALGFFSANYDRLRAVPGSIADFNSVLVWLFISLLFTVLAPGSSYLASVCSEGALVRQMLVWEQPFIQATTNSKRYDAAGHVFRALAILLIVGSIIFLGIGAFKFLSLVGRLSP